MVLALSKNKIETFKKTLIKTLEKIRDDEGNQEIDENEKEYPAYLDRYFTK